MLNLSSNSLLKFLPNFSILNKLKMLNLDKINPKAFKSRDNYIWNIKELLILTIADNKLEYLNDIIFKNMPKLIKLNVASNRLKNLSILQSSLKYLECLNIFNNNNNLLEFETSLSMNILKNNSEYECSNPFDT